MQRASGLPLPIGRTRWAEIDIGRRLAGAHGATPAEGRLLRALERAARARRCAQSRTQRGLTSISPKRAIGCLDAISMASSMVSQSRRSKPAIHSFVSAKGPSVTRSCPLRTRTVLAFASVVQPVAHDPGSFLVVARNPFLHVVPGRIEGLAGRIDTYEHQVVHAGSSFAFWSCILSRTARARSTVGLCACRTGTRLGELCGEDGQHPLWGRTKLRRLDRYRPHASLVTRTASERTRSVFGALQNGRGWDCATSIGPACPAIRAEESRT
jgi:hypothetical protein